MARKKADTKKKSRAGKKGSGQSWLPGFFRALTSTPWRQMIMLAIILAVLIGQWQNIQA